MCSVVDTGRLTCTHRRFTKFKLVVFVILGLEEEQKIHFSEHIFLDTHLEDWCPKKGPIRHFMELVCVGLSKNPFYTAQEKKEHIMWYKDYFVTKKDLLTEVGAWDLPNSNKEASV